MKKSLLYLWMSGALLALALVASGCKEEQEEKIMPEVSLSAGAVTWDSIEFTITPNAAEKCAYVCVAEGEAVPSAEEILGTAGTEVAVDKATPVALTDLAAETKYTVVAVARNKFGTGLAASLEMTTPSRVFDKFLTFVSSTKNSFSYHVKPAGTNGYTYLFIQSSELEGKPESMFGTLLSFYGSEAAEEKTFVLTDMVEDEEGEVSEVIPGMSYTILAAELDAEGDIAGDIFRDDFKTQEPELSAAQISVAAGAVTTTSVEYTTTPDANVSSYFQVWMTAVKYNKLMESEGEQGVKTMLFEEGKRYFEAETIKKDRLTAGTEYIVATIAYDKAYDQVPMLITSLKAAAQPTEPPTIDFKAYVSDKYGAEYGAYTYNSICCDIKATNVTLFKDCVLETAEVEKLLAAGGTYESIAKEKGFEWTMKEDIDDLNSAAGYIGYWKSGIKSSTAYTIIVYAENSYGTSAYAVATATTTAKTGVESELFTALLGEWTGSMQIKNKENVTENISFPVTIAAGVNEATQITYRNDNRLVCLGYADKAYRSPEQLIDELDWYKTHPDEAYKDYGPKWFLEIAAGDVVTVPSSDKVLPLYNYYEYPTYIVGYNGSAVSSKRPFGVTVSADRNTLTVKSYEVSGEGVFYPSILNDKGGSWGLITPVVSDVVLVRKTPASVVKAGISREVRGVK